LRAEGGEPEGLISAEAAMRNSAVPSDALLEALLGRLVRERCCRDGEDVGERLRGGRNSRGSKAERLI